MSEVHVYNRTTSNVMLEFPPPEGHKRGGSCVELPASGSVDVFPYFGSIEAALKSPVIKHLIQINVVRVRIVR